MECERAMSLYDAHDPNLWRADSLLWSALKISVSVRPLGGRRWKWDSLQRFFRIKMFFEQVTEKKRWTAKIVERKEGQWYREYEGKGEGRILGAGLGQILHLKDDSPLALTRSMISNGHCWSVMRYEGVKGKQRRKSSVVWTSNFKSLFCVHFKSIQKWCGY